MTNRGKTTTIRLLPDKIHVYDDFKNLVKDVLHSDICYVTTSLFEAFNQAVLKTPNANDPVTMKFLKQNVQINIGCNFNYNVAKARRNQYPPKTELDKNNFFPMLIEQWPTMTTKSKKFWTDRLKEVGIIKTRKRRPPSVSTRKKKGSHTRKKNKLHRIVRQLLSKMKFSSFKWTRG